MTCDTPAIDLYGRGLSAGHCRQRRTRYSTSLTSERPTDARLNARAELATIMERMQRSRLWRRARRERE
jgi:hypothetical protein